MFLSFLLFRYKYSYMEEMLGNIAGCRQVFERWMEWEPEEQAWHSYINFELRYKEVEKARSTYERYILPKFTLRFPNVTVCRQFKYGDVGAYDREKDYHCACIACRLSGFEISLTPVNLCSSIPM